MEGFRTIVRKTRVREADKFLQIAPCVIPPDMSLLEIAACVTQRPNARVLSVVDGEGKLIGLIRARLVFEDIFFQVMPEEFLQDASGVDKIVAFARLSSARTSRDVMQPPVAVTMEDSVRDAFERMHDNTLAGLPIVDSEYRVIGYLDMLEMMLVLLRSYNEQKQATDPSPEGSSGAESGG